MNAKAKTATREWHASVYFLKDTDLGVGEKKEKSRPFPKLIHKIRDGLSLLELSRILSQANYQYGRPLLQIPKDVLDGRRFPNPREVNDRISPDDLIVQVTRPPLIENGMRPPLDDTGVKRTLALSGTELEGQICCALGRYVETCDRSLVRLRAEAKVQDRFRKFRAVHFYQSGGGLVAEFDASTKKGHEKKVPINTALGYFLSVPKLSRVGPRLALSFSMGGSETLWFCHLLATQLAPLYREALASSEEQLWIVQFTCPDYTPIPALEFAEPPVVQEVIEVAT